MPGEKSIPNILSRKELELRREMKSRKGQEEAGGGGRDMATALPAGTTYKMSLQAETERKAREKK